MARPELLTHMSKPSLPLVSLMTVPPRLPPKLEIQELSSTPSSLSCLYIQLIKSYTGYFTSPFLFFQQFKNPKHRNVYIEKSQWKYLCYSHLPPSHNYSPLLVSWVSFQYFYSYQKIALLYTLFCTCFSYLTHPEDRSCHPCNNSSNTIVKMAVRIVL